MEQLFLHDMYYFLAFVFWWISDIKSKEIHHLITVRFASFVTVFGLTFLSLSSICIRSEARQIYSWDVLMELDDWTFIL